MFWILIVLLIVAASRRPRAPARRIRSRSDPSVIRTAQMPPGSDLTELIDAYCAEAAELSKAAESEPNRVKAATMRRRAAEMYFKCEKLDKKWG